MRPVYGALLHSLFLFHGANRYPYARPYRRLPQTCPIDCQKAKAYDSNNTVRVEQPVTYKETFIAEIQSIVCGVWTVCER